MCFFLPKKIAVLRTATFCLSKSPPFRFETICGCCATERRTLQIVILIFSSISSFMRLLCTRAGIANLTPLLHQAFEQVSFEECRFPYLLSGYVGRVVRYVSGPPAMRLWTQTRKTIVLAPPQDICFSLLICGTKLRPYIKNVAGGLDLYGFVPFPWI